MTVDYNQEYLDMMKELVKQGHSMNLMVSGRSMSPFLTHHRDFIYFEKPSRPLNAGDMVFYQRQTGQYVMHRIYKVNGNETYHMLGDNQLNIEPGIGEEQIFAIVTQVKRNGKMIDSRSMIWKFYERIWIRCLLMRRIVFKLQYMRGKR